MSNVTINLPTQQNPTLAQTSRTPATASTGNQPTASTVNPAAPTVNPLAPTVIWGVATADTEGAEIKLGTLTVTVNGLAGDSNSLQSLMVSAIPVGNTLSDGHGHSFTATSDNTSVDVTSWTLSSLTITTTNDVDFTLTATATVVDGDENISTASASEASTVNPQESTVGGGATRP